MNDNNAIQEDPQTERGEPKEQSQDSQKSTIMSDDHTEQPTLASENEMEAACDEEEHYIFRLLHYIFRLKQSKSQRPSLNVHSTNYVSFTFY